jgi:hypothetical protein
VRGTNIHPEQIRSRSESEIYSGRTQSGNVKRKLNSGEDVTAIYEKSRSNTSLGKPPQFLKKIGATFKSLLRTSVSSHMSTPASRNKALRNIKSEPVQNKTVTNWDYTVVGGAGGYRKSGDSKFFDRP